MSNGDIVTIIFTSVVIIFLLAKWGWLPQCPKDDPLLKYYRGDDLRGKW